MKLEESTQVLQLFGDGQSHTWLSIIILGVQYYRIRQIDLEKTLKRCLEYGLLKRDQFQPDPILDTYAITPKGDQLLREEMIRRGGDVSYYKYYDRSVDGSYGVNKYAPVSFPRYGER